MMNENLMSSNLMSSNAMSSNENTLASNFIFVSNPISVISSFIGPNLGGEKTITFLGGFNLLANNMTGPAIVLLPALFQQCGLIPTTLFLVIIAVLSGVCSWMIVEAMRLMPDNKDLTRRHEYMAVSKRYLTPTHHWIVFVFFQISTMTILISNIVQAAQIFDIAIADVFGCSYGLEYYPNFATFPCGNDLQNVDPWNNGYIISIGFILVTLCAVPFSMLNLDDNIVLQWIATVGFGIVCFVWIIIFMQQPTWNINHVPLATNNLSSIVGIILFNFAYIITIPSWANEAQLNVSTTKSLITSLSFTLIVFWFVGVFGAIAYEPYFNTDQDIFDKLQNSKGNLRIIAKITVYLKPIIQNLTGIPVFVVVIRYNLLEAGFSKFTSNFWALVFPWIVALPLYNGNGFNDLCNWAGVVLVAYVNFILPPYLFVWAYIENKTGMQIMHVNKPCTENNEADMTATHSAQTIRNKKDISVIKRHSFNSPKTDSPFGHSLNASANCAKQQSLNTSLKHSLNVNVSLKHSLNSSIDDQKPIYKAEYQRNKRITICSSCVLVLAWTTYIIMWLISVIGGLDFLIGCIDPKDRRCNN